MHSMGFGDKVLASIISVSILGGSPKSVTDTPSNLQRNSENIENTTPEYSTFVEMDSLSKTQKRTEREVSICLNNDSENSFTHKKVLDKISDSKDVVLEYPIAQLFQKYNGKVHPFAVSGIKKDFRALLGKNGIERLISNIPQKLTSHTEKITSDTKYNVEDTIRFSLIDPLLKDDFYQNLSDQLKEEGFTDFSDSDTVIFNQDSEKSGDFVYDIVVKKVPSGKSALALYRNGKLFLATYASVGLNDKKTEMGQFKVLNKEPYKRSRKYDNAAMPEALNFYGGYYIHQGDVTGYPASHGCVRLPGIFADVVYSLVKNSKSVDVFISKNLYKK